MQPRSAQVSTLSGACCCSCLSDAWLSVTSRVRELQSMVQCKHLQRDGYDAFNTRHWLQVAVCNWHCQKRSFRRAPFCVALPQTFRKIWQSFSRQDWTSCPASGPAIQLAGCCWRETRARLTNVGSCNLVVVLPVTDMSESPRKRRKESNQRTQGFLQKARLLDTCASGQKLLFLEHNWTVAHALKVITLAVRRAHRNPYGEPIRSLRVEKAFRAHVVLGTGTAPHIQRSAGNQA